MGGLGFILVHGDALSELAGPRVESWLLRVLAAQLTHRLVHHVVACVDLRGFLLLLGGPLVLNQLLQVKALQNVDVEAVERLRRSCLRHMLRLLRHLLLSRQRPLGHGCCRVQDDLRVLDNLCVSSSVRETKSEAYLSDLAGGGLSLA